MLEDRFEIPVYLNNDGDLFTLGEAMAGFLPWVNGLLEEAGSPRRFRNLFGATLDSSGSATTPREGRSGWPGTSWTTRATSRRR